MSPKVLAVIGLTALFGSRLTTCRSPGEGGGDRSQPRAETIASVKGVDTSALTGRERAEWSSAVSELLSPCPDQPVSIAQCVNEDRKCSGCLPAARYLLEQVRKGRTRTQAEAAYRARFAPDQIKNIELADTPVKGLAGAPVTIVEWADFECPACGAARHALDGLLTRYPEGVRIAFKHFPLSIHQNAEKAARASVAAQNQGKFWEMHAALFDNQTTLSVENVEKLAQKLGLDMARFRQERDSEATADKVARDRKQGEALNLESTPTLFINGRKFPPTVDFQQDLEEWVKLELEMLGQTTAAAPTASAAAPASAAPSGVTALPSVGAPAARSAAPVSAPAPAMPSAKRTP